MNKMTEDVRQDESRSDKMRDMCGRNDDQKAVEAMENCGVEADHARKRFEHCSVFDLSSKRDVFTDTKSTEMEDLDKCFPR